MGTVLGSYEYAWFYVNSFAVNVVNVDYVSPLTKWMIMDDDTWSSDHHLHVACAASIDDDDDDDSDDGNDDGGSGGGGGVDAGKDGAVYARGEYTESVATGGIYLQTTLRSTNRVVWHRPDFGDGHAKANRTPLFLYYIEFDAVGSA
jgi:hypothetical protein